MARGHFITFEGGEGAGKTTQILCLAEMLQDEGERVVTTREPGGSPGAEAVRSLLIDTSQNWCPFSEVLLHNAARFEHLHDVIQPALNSGYWVICDRFTDSTRAYQGYGLGVALETLNILENLTVDSIRPDLTIILDVPVDTGLMRVRQREKRKDRYENMNPAFHERLREGYRRIAADNPERCHLIDATLSTQAVQEEVRRTIKQYLMRL